MERPPRVQLSLPPTLPQSHKGNMVEDKTVQNFVTANLFIGSAITCETGIYPSRYVVTGNKKGDNFKVVMMWDEIPFEIKKKLDRRELLVCPRKLESVFLRIKHNVLNASDKMKNGDLNVEESN